MVKSKKLAAVMAISIAFSTNLFAESHNEKVHIGLDIKKVTINNQADQSAEEENILCINTELFSGIDSNLRTKLQEIYEKNSDSVEYAQEHLCISEAKTESSDLEDIKVLLEEEQAKKKEYAQELFRTNDEDVAETTRSYVKSLAQQRPKNLELKNFAVMSGVSVAMLGVWWVMPAEKSGWEADLNKRVKTIGRSYNRAYTNLPVWDDEAYWWVNWIGHPYCGSQTYLMDRNHGRSILQSFLFSTSMSFAWEYLFEAAVEHPSATDLVLTSTLGSVLGEGIFQATRLLQKGGLTKGEKVIVTIINPTYRLFKK